jgi:DnaD/phage-associated family protein
MSGLTDRSEERESVLRDAFERAAARGTLLHVIVQLQGQREDLYFMNSPRGRAAVKAIDRGDWWPGDIKRPIELIVERPNVFVLYEQNIGPLTPMIGDQLRDAEKEYPEGWVADAIQIAVEQNKRSWRYIVSILERWLAEGKQNRDFSRRPAQKSRYAHLEEDYSDLIES